jgi:hypothetical protein
VSSRWWSSGVKEQKNRVVATSSSLSLSRLTTGGGVEVWGPWRGGAKVSSLTMVKSWHRTTLFIGLEVISHTGDGL